MDSVICWSIKPKKKNGERFIDPEGAQRMFQRRFIATQDRKKIARLYGSEDNYIEEQVAEWRRKHRA
mgnify:CR=1 FL=1